jgi:hypothetical protein
MVLAGALSNPDLQAQSDMWLKEIRAEVERLLGEKVSPHSIKSYLHRGTYGSKPAFERIRHGHDRLRTSR